MLKYFCTLALVSSTCVIAADKHQKPNLDFIPIVTIYQQGSHVPIYSEQTENVKSNEVIRFPEFEIDPYSCPITIRIQHQDKNKQWTVCTYMTVNKPFGNGLFYYNKGDLYDKRESLIYEAMRFEVNHRTKELKIGQKKNLIGDDLSKIRISYVYTEELPYS